MAQDRPPPEPPEPPLDWARGPGPDPRRAASQIQPDTSDSLQLEPRPEPPDEETDERPWILAFGLVGAFVAAVVFVPRYLPHPNEQPSLALEAVSAPAAPPPARDVRAPLDAPDPAAAQAAPPAGTTQPLAAVPAPPVRMAAAPPRPPEAPRRAAPLRTGPLLAGSIDPRARAQAGAGPVQDAAALRDLAAADRQLRRAYVDAAVAGVSADELVSAQDAWEQLKARAPAHPQDVARAYRQLTARLAQAAAARSDPRLPNEGPQVPAGSYAPGG